MTTASRGRTREQLRDEFPILKSAAYGTPLIYLDNAATSQKPQTVINVMNEFWTTANANVHRGVHYLSMESTKLFDEARTSVREFLCASRVEEIIFTKGCTEGINLVAGALTTWHPVYKSGGLRTGDEIIVTRMEHHSNIVPWQMLAERTGAVIRVVELTPQGELDMDMFRSLLTDKTRVVAIVYISNSLGTINPVKAIVSEARKHGALTLVDAAQAGPHLRIDVQDLDADFLTLSCHKIYAPTGVGVLYGKLPHLAAMPPYQGGGDMIRTVSFERTTYADPPAKFEAGTPNVAGVIGLGAAIRWLAEHVGGAPSRTALGPGLDAAFEKIGRWEAEVSESARALLSEIPGVKIYGTARERAGIVSFSIQNVHPHDAGTALDRLGIAVRAGHHCCMPLMQSLGVAATTRASFAFFNSLDEAEHLARGVEKAREMFA